MLHVAPVRCPETPQMGDGSAQGLPSHVCHSCSNGCLPCAGARVAKEVQQSRIHSSPPRLQLGALARGLPPRDRVTG